MLDSGILGAIREPVTPPFRRCSQSRAGVSGAGEVEGTGFLGPLLDPGSHPQGATAA
jgi:hypothetical protein